jgi:hypothetical protein
MLTIEQNVFQDLFDLGCNDYKLELICDSSNGEWAALLHCNSLHNGVFSDTVQSYSEDSPVEAIKNVLEIFKAESHES